MKSAINLMFILYFTSISLYCQEIDTQREKRLLNEIFQCNILYQDIPMGFFFADTIHIVDPDYIFANCESISIHLPDSLLNSFELIYNIPRKRINSKKYIFFCREHEIKNKINNFNIIGSEEKPKYRYYVIPNKTCFSENRLYYIYSFFQPSSNSVFSAVLKSIEINYKIIDTDISRY